MMSYVSEIEIDNWLRLTVALLYCECFIAACIIETM